MQFLIFTIFCLISMTAHGAEKGINDLIVEYYWIAGGLILVVEYLIGISKIESNSVIEWIINFIKGLNPNKKK